VSQEIKNTSNGASSVQRANVIVLKFGGSVLRDEVDVWRAVHEIYRWTRTGHKVLAVVSAFEGQTDVLLKRANKFGPRASEHATALLVATGELTSAGVLGLTLHQAGLSSTVLSPSAIGLRTSGKPLDSGAVSVDVGAIDAAFASADVIVVPGFVGVDDQGHLTLLGRGGSDLTALFVAQRLGARVRLIKDVRGLYERDPAQPGPRPKRFATVSWDRAESLGGGIVQPKSIRFAREHGLSFEVGTAQRDEFTIVGPGHDRLDNSSERPDVPLRVSILGAGTVGIGVNTHVQTLRNVLEVAEVATRNPARAELDGVDASRLSDDPKAAVDAPCDVVVETLGGIEPALSLIQRALRQGKHVVTANKSVIARHGAELAALAQASGVRLLYSASVGGAVPAIETIDRLAASERIASIEGVVNGTSNFVIDRVAGGATFEQAVQQAQVAGFAEADPSRDLHGRDAADKLAILIEHAFGVRVDPESIQADRLEPAAFVKHEAALKAGRVLRQVVCAKRDAGGAVRYGVELRAIDREHPLAQTRDEHNRVEVITDRSRVSVTGKGAGRWPASQAVAGDLLQLVRELRAGRTRSGDGAGVLEPALSGAGK
jgi:homoserine dehydrogenase